jgi:hypothetical protein
MKFCEYALRLFVKIINYIVYFSSIPNIHVKHIYGPNLYKRSLCRMLQNFFLCNLCMGKKNFFGWETSFPALLLNIRLGWKGMHFK